jgi:hypothetical protein
MVLLVTTNIKKEVVTMLRYRGFAFESVNFAAAFNQLYNTIEV